MTRKSSGSPRPESGSELQRMMDAERTGAPFVMYRDSHGVLRVTELDQGGALTIGRRDTNHIALEWDPQVSRAHATLACVGGEWTITDDGLSRNGTFVNSSRISGRTRLRDGDVVRCGATALVVRVPEEAGLTVTAPPSTSLPPVESITDSQRRILIALCRPYKHKDPYAAPASNQQIADEVFLSVDAVKTHLRLLFQKFGIQDLPRTQKRQRLVECAFQWGLVAKRDL